MKTLIRLQDMTLDDLKDLLSDILTKPTTPKRVAFVAKIEAEIASRATRQQLAQIRAKLTKNDWLQLREAAKAPAHPLHAWFAGSNAYYQRAEHLRYPATHRKLLQLGEVAPRSQADLDLIAAASVDDADPAKPSPSQRAAMLKARSGLLAAGPIENALAVAVGAIQQLGEDRGQLSPAQSDFLRRAGVLK
jgi:hypothetical protein